MENWKIIVQLLAEVWAKEDLINGKVEFEKEQNSNEEADRNESNDQAA